MKIYDLTHPINECMPVYPGTEPPSLIAANSYDTDGFRETKLCMFSHTGTHIDPPAHLFEGKATLDQFDIGHFLGKALVIDCSEFKEGELIPKSVLKKYGSKTQEVDFLLFRTGWDKKWGTNSYFGDYPVLSMELLDFILQGNYKGIGFDVISLDPIKKSALIRHRKLLENKSIINIENLCKLEVFGDRIFYFSCFPLKVENSDGAPCRAVGWFLNEGECNGF